MRASPKVSGLPQLGMIHTIFPDFTDQANPFVGREIYSCHAGHKWDRFSSGKEFLHFCRWISTFILEDHLTGAQAC